MKKHASALLMLAVTGLSLNAHALCVNPDGSLDDRSVPTGSVVADMLPACGNAAPNIAATAPAPSKNAATAPVQTDLKIIASAKAKTAQ